MLQDELIAPCGMNCGLCIAYQAKVVDLNQYGFHRTYCPGCIPRGKFCTHMSDQCERIGTGKIRFCFECEEYPCKRLKSLDKRYRTKYHMSMIANLDYIRDFGMQAFLEKEDQQWKCPDCQNLICCHNGLCLNCDRERLVHNRKYRWGEQKD